MYDDAMNNMRGGVVNELVFESSEWLQQQYETYNHTYRQEWADRCKAELDKRMKSCLEN